MRNPYEELAAKAKKQEETPWEEIKGGFSCATCHEGVTDALYSELRKILKWKCSKGHISHIEADL